MIMKPTKKPFRILLLMSTLISMSGLSVACAAKHTSSGGDPAPSVGGDDKSPGSSRNDNLAPVDTDKIDTEFDEKQAKGLEVGDVAERRIAFTVDASAAPLPQGSSRASFTLNRKGGTAGASCATKIETREDDELGTVLAIELRSEATGGLNEDQVQRPSYSVREIFRYSCTASMIEVVLDELDTGHQIEFNISASSSEGFAVATSDIFRILNTSEGTKSVALKLSQAN